MRAPAIGTLELRRFGRAPLTKAAILALALIPLLYSGLYLWAFWDPYDNLQKIPVALVNADRPAAQPGGGTLHAGDDLVDTLIDRHTFDWHTTHAADASAGLDDGRYLMTFTIPAGFSAALVSPADTLPTGSDPAGTPRRGRLRLETNDASNYLAGVIGRSAFAEIRGAAADSAASRYFDRMFLAFGTLHNKTGKAADGAGALADGSHDARRGANRLADGSQRAKSGAGTLADGLNDAHHGAQRLADGLVGLNSGAARLDDGAGRAAAGTRQLAHAVDGVDASAAPFLRRNAGSIRRSATLLADGADTVAEHIDELPRYIDRAAETTTAAQRALDRYADRHPDQANDPDFRSAQRAVDHAARSAHQAQTRLRGDRDALATIKADARQVARLARQVSQDAPHLADRLHQARQRIDTLNDGMQSLASGAATLHKGTASAASGAKTLTGGLYRLSTGARQLDGGLGSLSSGAGRLATGLGSLEHGANRLADGLADGSRQIPDYDAKQRADRAGVMADPVDLHRAARNAAASYGEGFAPYFLGLSLWVGAMVGYMLLRPVTRRHLMSGARAWRVAAAGWLPAIAIGVVQAGILEAVLHFALGLDPVRPWAMLGLLATAVVAYTGLQQLFGAALGAAGRVLTLVLLIAQLVTAGGTYPLQTSPTLLARLHPFLPMSYVVDCLRHVISGGSTGMVAAGAGILMLFGAGAFAVTCLVVRRSARLSPTTLHPDLEL